MKRKIEQILEDQAADYRQRAGEYDEWWFYCKGKYDRGAEKNAAWFAGIEVVKNSLS